MATTGQLKGKLNGKKVFLGDAVVLEPQTWIDLNGPEFENVPLEGITIAV